MAKIVLKAKKPSKPISGDVVRMPASTAKDVIQILKKHRKELSISQEEVARLVNLNRQSVSNIERFEADPQLSNVMEMLRVCGIKMVLEFTAKETKNDGSEE
ncbi:helix-turn-helix transcriptional regulator [Bdellovibrio bacteriovorus]|uniref:helix-turn-helix transcriptional regulator n=1 Tax=Bdellovibrio TaxID=958 RepID=UPI0035A84332